MGNAERTEGAGTWSLRHKYGWLCEVYGMYACLWLCDPKQAGQSLGTLKTCMAAVGAWYHDTARRVGDKCTGSSRPSITSPPGRAQELLLAFSPDLPLATSCARTQRRPRFDPARSSLTCRSCWITWAVSWTARATASYASQRGRGRCGHTSTGPVARGLRGNAPLVLKPSAG
jgi:hypothetical protein